MASDTTKVANILILLGGIFCLLYGILTIIGAPFALLPGLNIGGALGGLIIGIIQIILALVTLATSGVVKIPALKLEKNWVIILILGIIMYVFAAGLPGILVIIGAILLLL
ncbi:MAG: hypothetical protein K9W43_01925 [Candidatus Thorarchaeota archaeon]|nr:hypothetical protein [Candidatus Thorarchaeota archaeon]